MREKGRVSLGNPGHERKQRHEQGSADQRKCYTRDECSGSTVSNWLRSKVNRRANAYTGGVSNDQTNEMVIFQASNCAQLSGLPMDAV